MRKSIDVLGRLRGYGEDTTLKMQKRKIKLKSRKRENYLSFRERNEENRYRKGYL